MNITDFVQVRSNINPLPEQDRYIIELKQYVIILTILDKRWKNKNWYDTAYFTPKYEQSSKIYLDINKTSSWLLAVFQNKTEL